MPFIGRDWRSPGDQWVRTTEGWERMRLWRVKIFENLNQNAVARITRLALEDSHHTCEKSDITSRRQSYIFFNSGSTKEKLELTSLSEALVRLDMTGAARDINRANYVAKLMTLILEKRLPVLSGTSQKLVFNILESMVNEAIKTELNIGMMKDLLECAYDALQDGKHHHIGSQCLWSKHMETVNRLANKLSEYQMKERNKDGKLMLDDLPADCLRVIFSQISDHKDVMRAGQTSSTLNQVTEERSLWREMCLFHFNNRQILTFLPKQNDTIEIDWKNIYKRCYKRFGRKETFADMLAICTHCCSIHWKALGHPCVGDQMFTCKVLSPADFLSLFKL
ncbi:F-box only protein 32-like [Physella acuta]|uniref:F-box only protein 32-like n=1 Tax=Physella acuta TaxID=109671 RepID=UPI0027DBFF3B|nr:F-box only protein 32-like [Physella acuta]